ncbi:hypothetical protein BXZ70DRAFT_1042224 [Cristinia sonorae]|uniref:DUF6534 domain-containing protein n=1 Tax=Cristinia sonorae TaxID=1940300 RepID=A0A8K0XLV8_9AGAR|nr:hypothetical protein BXZ70DRAFT_1042224 [Cristinia sonorae]
MCGKFDFVRSPHARDAPDSQIKDVDLILFQAHSFATAGVVSKRSATRQSYYIIPSASIPTEVTMSSLNATSVAPPFKPSTDLKLVAGPLLIAYLVHWSLFGILTGQSYIYYVAFPKDHWITKAIVSVSYFLEAAQFGFLTHDAYRVFGRGWGDIAELNNVGLLWFGASIMAGIVTTVCHHLYAWRIFALTGRQKYTVPIIISLLSFVQLGLGVRNGVVDFRAQQLSNFMLPVDFDVLLVAGSAWITSTALCDIIITASMFYFLWEAKKSSFSRPTTTVLTRLIKVTIETGFLSAFFTILELVLFVTERHSTLYSIFLGASSKLYSNTLLVVLNSRVRIAGGRVQGDSDDVNAAFSTLRFARTEEGARSSPARTDVSVEVTVKAGGWKSGDEAGSMAA